jgi:hypothetical protein
MASPMLIRADTLVATPWKNGGGSTREIAAEPAGAGLDRFVWRVSLADVAQAGPFSRFDGVDRTLVLLAGGGMRLDQDDGESHLLAHALDRIDFAGETAIHASLPDGATRDFNLMVRRGAVRGQVKVWQGPDPVLLNADTALLFCATGPVDVQLEDEPALRLNSSDTLRIDAARGMRCRQMGAGALLIVEIHHA